MPLPIFCSDGLPPCCECLYQTVAKLVDAAADAVLDCIADETLCKEFARYVSIGRPVDQGDFVAGWVVGGGPLGTSTDKQVVVPKQITTIMIKLMESGFPPPIDSVGSRILRSGWQERDFAAQYFYAHHEAAYRAMLNVRAPHCEQCGRVQFVSHAAGQPEATFVHWEYTFRTVAAP